MQSKHFKFFGFLLFLLQICLLCVLWNKQFHTNCKSLYVKSKESNYTYTTPTKSNKIIFCFPFLHELDLLHIKLLTLSDYVELFVLAESPYDERGYEKELTFNLHKNESRFQLYGHKIFHVIDYFKPTKQGKDLGWTMTQRMRNIIGEKIIHQLSEKYPDTIVLFGDADEVPSAQSLQWLTDHCCDPSVTYEFSSTLPSFQYSLQWMTFRSGGNTGLTARSMKDEALFWKMWLSGMKSNQNLLPLPFYPSGWHCSYCFTSDLCVNKLKHANLADGPPFLGLYEWSVELFDALRACGVAPQGNTLMETKMNTDVSFPEWDKTLYPYLFNVQICSNEMLALIEEHKKNRY